MYFICFESAYTSLFSISGSWTPMDRRISIWPVQTVQRIFPLHSGYLPGFVYMTLKNYDYPWHLPSVSIAQEMIY
jgi:hypothetical protein